MVKITDHHDMTSTVYGGRKARTINILLITGSGSENLCAHAHFHFLLHFQTLRYTGREKTLRSLNYLLKVGD